MRIMYTILAGPLVKITMTTIELTEEEVEQFKAFRQHQDRFNVLYDAGFFNIRGASGTVHFDSEGNIRKIESISVKMYTVTKLH
jgi:hypothetical protein